VFFARVPSQSLPAFKVDDRRLKYRFVVYASSKYGEIDLRLPAPTKECIKFEAKEEKGKVTGRQVTTSRRTLSVATKAGGERSGREEEVEEKRRPFQTHAT